MMSIGQIEDNARKMARISRRERIVPVTFTEAELVAMRKGYKAPRTIPMIGARTPKGWKLLQKHFVDSSGFGAPGEAALTQTAFFERMQPGLGYAVVQAGQFQVYVGEFIPRAGTVPRNPTPPPQEAEPDVEVEVRQIDPRRCQFYILSGEHYRADGSCKCDSASHRAIRMKEWGYKARDFKTPATKP